jgi:intracellular sulfur oxidation DsrE/DsrF family protein
MNMQKFLATIVLAMAFFIAETTFANTSYAKQKVIYHVNYLDMKRSIGAMRDAQNHINALGQGNHEIRFVLHGNGVELLRKVTRESPDASNRIDSLRSAGVKFNICANTLRGRKITLDDLRFAEEDDIVLSGVAEIGKLQQDGFVYFRP